MTPKMSEEATVKRLLRLAIPDDGCLICHLAPSRDRGIRERHYVQVGGRTGTKWRVTRLVWYVVMGRIENDLWVLHTCDNPACINPEHLFTGTAQDNTDDMIAKGRKKEDPEVAHRRKLFTAKQIGPLLAQGLDRYAIAERTRLSPSTIWNYINGPYRDYLSVSSRNVSDDSVGLNGPRDVKDLP